MSGTVTLPKRSPAPWPAQRLTSAAATALKRIASGPDHHQRWERPALLTLLLITSFLYCWDLDVNGWANSYYSAAVMAGSEDWNAFLFGSSDSGNAITVDKPPMSIWVMVLSVKIFGFSSWSILLPQAIMGIICVYLVYALVRRFFEAPVGLVAAGFTAIMPVCTAMFRYNNPDALLVLIMVGIAHVVLHAVSAHRPYWLVVAGAFIGAGFLTKQLQIMLVLPAVLITSLLYLRTGWLKRLFYVGLTTISAVAVAGSWLLTVQLTDPASRPYIGGSVTNSTLELALGYNGVDRLTGNAGNRPPISAAEGDQLASGFLRFLGPGFTGQIGWLLPLAFAGLAIAVFRISKKLCSDFEGAALVFLSLWFITSMTVIAYMSGIVHPYYTLTAVPPLAALAATGLKWMLTNRQKGRIRLALALTMISTLMLSYVSAVRSSADFPWLAQILLAAWAITIALDILPPRKPNIRAVSAILLGTAVTLGPIVWSVNTLMNPHMGAGVIAGPAIHGVRGDHPNRLMYGSNVPPGVDALMLGDSPSNTVIDRITQNEGTPKWVTAVVGSETAANYQLVLHRPVLALGGFNGTDPFPTLPQFQSLVADGKVSSVVIQTLPLTVQGRGSEAAKIVEWVRSAYAVQSMDGAEFYDLTKAPTP